MCGIQGRNFSSNLQSWFSVNGNGITSFLRESETAPFLREEKLCFFASFTDEISHFYAPFSTHTFFQIPPFPLYPLYKRHSNTTFLLHPACEGVNVFQLSLYPVGGGVNVFQLSLYPVGGGINVFQLSLHPVCGGNKVFQLSLYPVGEGIKELFHLLRTLSEEIYVSWKGVRSLLCCYKNKINNKYKT
jgi:hypothetical protein